MNDTEVTKSFLEETLCRFISDNDLWEVYKDNKDKVNELFVKYCNDTISKISIT